VVGVEQWAEVRRLHFVRRLSIREIHRRIGLHRDTILRALAPVQVRQRALEKTLQVEAVAQSSPLAGFVVRGPLTLLGMGQNFLACDREQELLLPASLREWLPEEHLAWCVLDAVGAIDLDAFYAAYRQDGHGRAAHDPAMMVALLLYSYAVGQRSSRKIERRWYEDVASRVICATRTPDHATIARFRARHERALAQTFTQVLALCAKAGLVSVGPVAVDGTLIAADAARAATRTHELTRDEVERILGEAAEIDAAEDERHGADRGDELPVEVRDRRSRVQRLRRCREELEAEQAQAQADHERTVRWRAQWEAEHARKLGGRKPTPPDPDALSRRKVNTTDPESRLLYRAGRTAVQGYKRAARRDGRADHPGGRRHPAG
jgi:transposase